MARLLSSAHTHRGLCNGYFLGLRDGETSQRSRQAIGNGTRSAMSTAGRQSGESAQVSEDVEIHVVKIRAIGIIMDA